MVVNIFIVFVYSNLFVVGLYVKFIPNASATIRVILLFLEYVIIELVLPCPTVLLLFGFRLGPPCTPRLLLFGFRLGLPFTPRLLLFGFRLGLPCTPRLLLFGFRLVYHLHQIITIWVQIGSTICAHISFI